MTLRIPKVPPTAWLLLVASACACVYFTGLYCSDDGRYLIGALKIAAGEPISLASVAERRLFFILPAALVFGLTGSLTAAIAFYSLFFVGLVLVTWRAGLRLMQPPFAALAALLVLAQPIVFTYSGAVLPDLASSMLLGLALICLLDWHRAELAEPAGRRSLRPAFLAGMSLAAAIAIKESSAVVALLAGCWAAGVALRGRLRPRALLPGVTLVAGVAAMLLIEAVAFRLFAGQWHSSLNNVATPHDFLIFLDEQGRTPWQRVNFFWLMLDPISRLILLLGLAAAIGAVFLKRTRRLFGDEQGAWLIVALWLAWPLVYFTIGTTSLRQYIPPVMQARYYAPCAAPAALLLAGLFQQLARRFLPESRRALRTAAVAVAIALAIAIPVRKLAHRGNIYFAISKEAYWMALADAADRFPGVPLVETDGGFTSDLATCRLLLRAERTDSREAFFQAMRGADGVLGSVTYPAAEKLSPPFLLVGHGNYWDAPAASSFVGQIKARSEASGWRSEAVGRYLFDSRKSRRKWWMPREQAVLSSLARRQGEPLAIDVSAGMRRYDVELHLVTE